MLPVLYGYRFIARVDPAFDRSARTFTIKNWWWEEGVQTNDPEMLSAVQACLKDLATYLGAEFARDGRFSQ